VAREFGIPCVVNAKIATKVFKDGEMIEVDANDGTVRKV
jgi:phosphohistidine swiveling domain-containing protein